MPLIIEDKTFTESSNLSCIEPDNVFKSFPQLEKDSKQFIDDVLSGKQTTSVDVNADRVLYVLQEEFATVSTARNATNIKYIGSDDATTCHIVIMKHSASETVSLVHLDGSETFETLQKMLAEIHDICKYSIQSSSEQMSLGACAEEESVSPFDIDLFVFGGFVDDKKYSEQLFEEILIYGTKLKDNLHLKLAPCYSLNTVKVGPITKPIIYGILIDIASGEIFSATFKNKGPDLHLRHLKMRSDIGVSSCYDYHRECLKIPQFSYQPPRYIHQLLALPDQLYLQYTSTSPECEPADFVETSKATFQFMLDNNDRKVFEKGERCHVLSSDGKWTLL